MNSGFVTRQCYVRELFPVNRQRQFYVENYYWEKAVEKDNTAGEQFEIMIRN